MTGLVLTFPDNGENTLLERVVAADFGLCDEFGADELKSFITSGWICGCES